MFDDLYFIVLLYENFDLVLVLEDYVLRLKNDIYYVIVDIVLRCYTSVY